MAPLSSIADSGIVSVPPVRDTGSSAEQQAGSSTGNSAASATAAAIRLPEDKVTLSGMQPDQNQTDKTSAETDPAPKEAKPGEKTTPDGKSIEDPQVQQQISRLKDNEEKVKAHEAAHKSVGGSLASAASYSYTQGPDGRNYITGGEVQINMSDGSTPQETITRMQQVIRAALAPADPSGQDRAVAAQAASRMAQAQMEKLQTENPAAKPAPGQPVEPDKETPKAAADPAAVEKRAGSGSVRSTDLMVQQTYGNPAVQGTNSTSDQPSLRNSGSSMNGMSSFISTFA